MFSATEMPGVMPLLGSQLAAFLALLLAASAMHKGVRWAHTQSVIHEFAGVPRAAAAWAAVAALLGELLAAALLFVPASRLIGALLAALIWGAYLALILRAIVQGRRNVDCGCSFGSSRHPLGAFDVTRSVVLVVFAVLVGTSAANGAVPVSASQVLASCALLALYGALDQVMTLQPLRNGAVS
jgi:methylamine utilization protein MauE